jgi:hypothetical protein
MCVLGASADSVAPHALTAQPHCVQCPPPVYPVAGSWKRFAALRALVYWSSCFATNVNAAPSATAAAASANRRRCWLGWLSYLRQ